MFYHVKREKSVFQQQWPRDGLKKIDVDMFLQCYWSAYSVSTLTVTSTVQLGTVSASRYPSFSPEASEISSLNRVLPVPLLSVKISGVCSGTLKKPFPVITRCWKQAKVTLISLALSELAALVNVFNKRSCNFVPRASLIGTGRGESLEQGWRRLSCE